MIPRSNSRLTLSNALAQPANNHITIIFLLSNRQDVTAWCNNITLFNAFSLTLLGNFKVMKQNGNIAILLAYATHARLCPRV